MLMIAEMADDMRDELRMSDSYYRRAVRLKEEHPDVARKYIDLARAELSHAMTLHSLGIEKANEMRSKAGVEVPAIMETVFKEAHQRYHDEYDRLSYLIGRFTL